MKGGISSGVVYAGAVVELGRDFRFRRIGGTSAGAIGAAVAAAAEYRRQGDGPAGLAELLQRLIEDLTTPRFFPRLLQPAPGAEPVIAVILALLRQERSPFWRALSALGRVLLSRWWLPLGTAIAATAGISTVILEEGVSVPLTIVLVALVLALAIVIGVAGPVLLLTRATKRVLEARNNQFGLCSGISRGSEPALTDWLHATLQDIAGLPSHEPLTFAQLEEKCIELAMVATDLGSASPVRLPVTTGYSYVPADMEALFPEDVCRYLKRLAGKPDEQGLLPLPGKKLPVIVALRMSLSVPLLLACVPLYAHDRGPNPPSRARRSWITDGGVTSNFPIHFFDAWLPLRPTFGLDLRPSSSRSGKRVELPGPDDPPRSRWEQVGGIVPVLQQIVDAAQNWRDTAQAELPGFRDRVCQVRLEPGEGGLHLNMSPEVIHELIKAGRLAGRKLVCAFDERGLRGHQARRYLTLMRELQVRLHELDGAFRGVRGRLDGALPDDAAYQLPFIRRAEHATAGLLEVAAWWRQPPDAVDFEAGPTPEPPVSMRVGPGP